MSSISVNSLFKIKLLKFENDIFCINSMPAVAISKFRVNDLKFDVVRLEGRAGKAKRLDSLSTQERYLAYFTIAFILSNGVSASSVWLDFQSHFSDLRVILESNPKYSFHKREYTFIRYLMTFMVMINLHVHMFVIMCNKLLINTNIKTALMYWRNLGYDLVVKCMTC